MNIPDHIKESLKTVFEPGFQGWKKTRFKKKKPAQWFFGLFGFFCFFWVFCFFCFFYIFARKREFLVFFQFPEYF
jgi:hypothetical protein